MILGKLIRFVVTSLAALLVSVFIVIAAFVVNKVSIPLDTMRPAVLAAAREYAGRDVRIDGEVKLEVSLTPTIRVDAIRIHNPGGWQNPDFIRIGEARLQIGLLPLLRRQLEILDIAINDVMIDLEHKNNGEKNWLVPVSAPDARDAPGQETADKARIKDDFSVSQFSLVNVSVNFYDQGLDKNYSAAVDSLHINTQDRSKLVTTFSGKLGDTDYRLSARSDLLRRLFNGESWNLEAQGQLGEHPLEIMATLDTVDGTLGGEIQLSLEQLDIGQILDRLQITQGLDFNASAAQITAQVQGRDLQQILDQSTIDIALSDGSLTMQSHVDERLSEIHFARAEIAAVKREKLVARFNGRIGEEPLTFTLLTNPLSHFVTGLAEIEIAIEAELARARLKIDGDIALPITSKSLSVDLSVEGERLDQWNRIMINDLPPFGPYKLRGKVKMSPKGVHVTDFESVIGSSDLGGTIDIDMTGTRPLWKMDLISKQFQLRDFLVEGYSLIPGKQSASKEASDAAPTQEQPFLAQADQRIDESLEIDEWDLDISLDARKVMTDQDHVGDGQIVLSARKDRFDERFHINIPAGKLQGEMGFQRAHPGISGYFKLDMEKFDYGIFMRHLDPDAEADGLISAKIDLKLAGKDYSHSMEQSNGTIDMAVWPRNINADIMDIWAINLFFAVLPKVSTEESRVNCMVSVLDVEDGQLNEQFFALDSTKVWLNGNLDISFPEQEVSLSLFPKAKKARVFGLELPVILKGDFEKQELVVNKSRIAGSVLSFILSPLHAPMRRIFEKHIPSDASEKCGELMDREYLAELQQRIKEYKESRSKQYY